MPVFYCVHCGQPIEAEDALMGADVGCPGCRSVVRVPGTPPPSMPVFATAASVPVSVPRSSASPWLVWGVVALVLLGFGALIMSAVKRPFASVSGVPSSPAAREALREELNRLEADIKNMREGKPPAADTEPHPNSSQVAGASVLEKIVAITREYFAEVAALQNNYMEELKKTGLMELLDPARLTRDTEFRESYASLDRARKLVREQGSRMRKALSSLPARMRASDLDTKAKEDAALHAETGTVRALKLFDETWEIEGNSLSLFTEIIDLLKARQGHWGAENGQILFEEQGDANRFNALLAKVDAGAKRQEEIRKQGGGKSEKMFDDLRSVIPE